MKTIIEFVPGIRDGGAETLIKDYALLVDKNRFRIVIVSIRPVPESANTRILKENNVEIIYIYESWNLVTRIVNKILGNHFLSFKFRRIVNKIKPDCIHVHLPLLGVVDAISEDLRGIKIFYTCHTILERLFKGDNSSEYIAAKNLIENCNMRLITIQEHMCNETNKLFGIDNAVIIRNGIDLSKFNSNKSDRNEIRKRLGIPAEAYVIGNVGRFVELKNHMFLLDVFENIKKKKEDAFLLMVGDGELKNKIEREVKYRKIERCTLILSHRSDIYNILKTMDVFVFPSMIEGFGMVVIEAQASGIPCFVSSNVPEEVQVSNLVSFLELKSGADEWAEKILDYQEQEIVFDGLEKYDIRFDIHELEKLYDE